MTISDTAAPRRRPWQRVVSGLIGALLALASVSFVFAVGFAATSGSMDLQAGGGPGVLLSGTFSYRYHNPSNGHTLDLPVTIPTGFHSSELITVDTTDAFFGVEDTSDFGPFGEGGRGTVALPDGVSLMHELNGSGLTQTLRAGQRLELGVDHPVGWRGRLLVALPSVLIITGLWAAFLMYGTFLRSILDGQPFHPKNPRRLLVLTGSLAVVLLADSWLRVWITRAVLDVLGRHGHPIPLQVDNPSLNVAPILVIIGLLCLAGAFRAGTRMAAGVEGLV